MLPNVLSRFIAILRPLFIFGLIGALLVFGVIGGSHLAIEAAGKDNAFNSAADVPTRECALVLGCAKTLRNGRRNLFFLYRINAAAELYALGKCKYFIVSGDNSRNNYDEPTDMRDALIAKGIPADRIYRDYAGFRTLDSVVRANAIFGQDDFIIVSQSFHNERALFIAQNRGSKDTVALNARNVGSIGGKKAKARELFARVKTVLDLLILRTQPRFLGNPVQIGGPVT